MGTKHGGEVQLTEGVAVSGNRTALEAVSGNRTSLEAVSGDRTALEAVSGDRLDAVFSFPFLPDSKVALICSNTVTRAGVEF